MTDVNLQSARLKKHNKQAVKSYGYASSLFGSSYGYGTVGRNQDLPATKWGAALAFSSISPVNRSGNLWGSGIDAVDWRITDQETEEVVGEKNDWRTDGEHPASRAIREVRRDSGESLFFRWGVARAIPGENYVLMSRNKPTQEFGEGLPRRIDWLNPLGVTPQLSGTNEVLYYQYSNGGATARYSPDEVSFDRSFNLLSDVTGLSPAMAAMFENNILRNVMRAWMAQFRNGATPGGMIVPKSMEDDPDTAQKVGFTKTEQEYIRSSWASEMKGVDNTGSVLVPGKPIDFIQFEQPDYAKQIPMDDTMRTAIYTSFGISAPVAGDVRGLQYKAGQEIFGLFVAGVLTPQLQAIQDEVNATIIPFFEDPRTQWGKEPGRYKFEFDLSVFDDTTDAAEKKEAVINANYSLGLTTFNETRIAKGIEPIEGGDKLALPAGLTFVDVNEAFASQPEDDTVALPDQTGEEIAEDGTTITPPAQETSGAITEGVPDLATADGEVIGTEVAPDTVLNGAQLAQANDITERVANRQLPYESAIGQMMVGFNMSREQAELWLGEVGLTFFIDESDGDTDPQTKAALLSQAAVNYTESSPSEKRCGSCRWFSPGAEDVGTCQIVEGTPLDIVPDGGCDRWEGSEDEDEQPAPPLPDTEDELKSEVKPPGAFIGIRLANHPELMEIQSLLKESLPDESIEWELPETFHITLVWGEGGDEEKVASLPEQIETRKLTVSGKKLGLFDTPDEKALHLKINQTEELADFQQEMVALVQDADVDVSPFHETREDFTPHITMAYLPPDTDLSALDKVIEEFGYIFSETTDGLQLNDGNRNILAIFEDSEDFIASRTKAWLRDWQANALAEIKAWRKVLKNKKKSAFVAHHLTERAIYAIQTGLAAGEQKPGDLFKQAERYIKARAILPINFKALEDTRAEYESSFQAALDLFRLGEIDRRRWAQDNRNLIKRLGTQAYLDGLEAAGVTAAEGDDRDSILTPEDKQAIKEFIASQSQFVTKFGAELKKEDISAEQANLKPSMWFKGSIRPFYQDGLLSGRKNGMLEFTGKDGNENCATCKKAKGQIHRAKAWKTKGLFNNTNFICGRFQCEHEFTPTTERAKGRLGTIPLAVSA